MVKKLREVVSRTYRGYDILVEKEVEYQYDTMESRNKHANKMLSHGYSDSGQVMENIGSFMKPVHVTYARFFKVCSLKDEAAK